MLKESSSCYSPHNTIEEMEVEMILLNLTDEILENAWKEGTEVVKMEITPGVVVGVAEVEEEANLILRAMMTWSMLCFWTTLAPTICRLPLGLPCLLLSQSIHEGTDSYCCTTIS